LYLPLPPPNSTNKIVILSVGTHSPTVSAAVEGPAVALAVALPLPFAFALQIGEALEVAEKLRFA
jgi:hypothetical protein